MKKLFTLALFAIATPGLASLPELQVSRAQAQMLKRIDAAVAAYADKIGVSEDLITYCRSQMFLDTRHQADGSIPFGVNYQAIENESQLEVILSVREAYETNYLILCLARAKITLDQAERLAPG